ncbi:response regulator transcription factor [Chitinimonas sp.]|uniref:response regulator transcription factor n=1 Tax=Chitinimonas sp. TaxID=1934313 RepID=UPI002F91D70F
MIRIWLADDHTIVREGLKQLLQATPDLQVAGEACNGDEVLEAIRRGGFELLLLDMSMPGKSGIELIKQVRREAPALRILVLTMHEEHQYAIRAIRAGAAGYLTKESASAQLVSAIRRVAGGGAYISAEVAQMLALQAMPQAETPLHTTLSDREYQVFQRLVAGQLVTDIAEQLHLSVKTVSTHKARLLQKMNMQSQAELVRYAVEHRLFE